ncbi:MAG: N-acetylmuramoyl-L-alanine amidase [Clostridia bacterium]|nr:N-acetylmuramoyl-L-alanine amidase [Clostridia bacterium]
MKIIKKLVDKSKYNIKCPFKMTATRIVIHETANDASAENEIAYMIRNNNEVSYHFAVDDIKAVQGLPLDRNGWHASDGNGKGNREGIAIEICYSKSGGERWRKAVENGARLTAQLLKERGWGIDKVTKHQDYCTKYCPHRILGEYGWNNFLDLVKGYLENKSGKQPEKKISVTYQVWDNVQNKWLPNVTDLTDYAGIYGHDICCVFANITKGNIYYKVHTKGGKWLPQVKNREDYAGILNKSIDALMMKTNTGKKIYYAVHLKKSNKWLPFVTGYNAKDSNNGYAGILGQEIDGIKIYLE